MAHDAREKARVCRVGGLAYVPKVHARLRARLRAQPRTRATQATRARVRRPCQRIDSIHSRQVLWCMSRLRAAPRRAIAGSCSTLLVLCVPPMATRCARERGPRVSLSSPSSAAHAVLGATPPPPACCAMTAYSATCRIAACVLGQKKAREAPTADNAWQAMPTRTVMTTASTIANPTKGAMARQRSESDGTRAFRATAQCERAYASAASLQAPLSWARFAFESYASRMGRIVMPAPGMPSHPCSWEPPCANDRSACW